MGGHKRVRAEINQSNRTHTNNIQPDPYAEKQEIKLINQ